MTHNMKTLGEKVEFLASQANEIAFGWNDSGCFWHMQIGPRGAGNFIPHIGIQYNSEADTFEEAVEDFIQQYVGDKHHIRGDLGGER